MKTTKATFAKINIALGAALSLAACAPAEAPRLVASDDQACERVMSVLAGNTTCTADQMASCEGGKDENNPGFYVLRVNANCREPHGCGSVLLGWYAVDAATGAVHDWDVGEWQIGLRIDRNN